MDDKLSGIRRWRREFLSNVYERVFLDTSRRNLQWVFSFEETGPRWIQPVFVFNMRLLPGIVICFFADLLIFIFDILQKIVIFVVQLYKWCNYIVYASFAP